MMRKNLKRERSTRDKEPAGDKPVFLYGGNREMMILICLAVVFGYCFGVLHCLSWIDRGKSQYYRRRDENIQG